MITVFVVIPTGINVTKMLPTSKGLKCPFNDFWKIVWKYKKKFFDSQKRFTVQQTLKTNMLSVHAYTENSNYDGYSDVSSAHTINLPEVQFLVSSKQDLDAHVYPCLMLSMCIRTYIEHSGNNYNRIPVKWHTKCLYKHI